MRVRRTVEKLHRDEALHGVKTPNIANTTQFPQVVGLAQAFDLDLVGAVGAAIAASDTRAVFTCLSGGCAGVSVMFTPDRRWTNVSYLPPPGR